MRPNQLTFKKTWSGTEEYWEASCGMTLCHAGLLEYFDIPKGCKAITLKGSRQPPDHSEAYLVWFILRVFGRGVAPAMIYENGADESVLFLGHDELANWAAEKLREDPGWLWVEA